MSQESAKGVLMFPNSVRVQKKDKKLMVKQRPLSA
jgi:hypothetical protein